jgi:hypothetical protein
MAATWTVRDGNGELHAEFVGSSPLEVGRRIVPTRYDAFRLQVAPSYRAMFDRAVAQVLEREGWQIVRVKAPTRPGARTPTSSAPTPREKPHPG